MPRLKMGTFSPAKTRETQEKAIKESETQEKAIKEPETQEKAIKESETPSAVGGTSTQLGTSLPPQLGQQTPIPPPPTRPVPPRSHPRLPYHNQHTHTAHFYYHYFPGPQPVGQVLNAEESEAALQRIRSAAPTSSGRLHPTPHVVPIRSARELQDVRAAYARRAALEREFFARLSGPSSSAQGHMNMPPRKSNVSAASVVGDESSTVNGDVNGPAGDEAEKGRGKRKDRDDTLAIEDLTMPRTMVQRLAKGVLPPNTQIQRDAITALSKGATVFINHIMNAANSYTMGANRKTVSPQDLLSGLRDTEFGFMEERLEAELAKYIEVQTGKRNEYRKKRKDSTSTGVDGRRKSQPDAAGEVSVGMVDKGAETDLPKRVSSAEVPERDTKRARLDPTAKKAKGREEPENEVDADDAEAEDGAEEQENGEAEEDEEEEEEEEDDDGDDDEEEDNGSEDGKQRGQEEEMEDRVGSEVDRGGEESMEDDSD